MARYGFIQTKEDVKFLILYAMGFLTFPVGFESVADICTWCDDGFSFFELKEAFDEMVASAHITQKDGGYQITDKGREAAQLFESHLPFTVRESAQKSALRVVQKLRRDAAITTSVQVLADCDLVVSMEMQEVFSLSMHVVNHSQAALLERNFKENAEQIYQVLLDAVTRNYTGEEAAPQAKEGCVPD